jgi:hypothetical protein
MEQSDQDEDGQEDGSDEISMIPDEPNMDDANQPLVPDTPTTEDLQADMGNAMGDAMGNAMGAGNAMGEGNAAPAMGEGDGGGNMFVRCMVLTIRSGPDVSHGVQGYLVFNAEVTPLEKQGKWVKIANKKWISGPYLTSSMNSKPSLPSAH